MTNKERILKEMFSTEVMARYLVVYNDDWGQFCTSDGNGFYYKEDAINHEIQWLLSESKDDLYP